MGKYPRPASLRFLVSVSFFLGSGACDLFITLSTGHHLYALVTTLPRSLVVSCLDHRETLAVGENVISSFDKSGFTCRQKKRINLSAGTSGDTRPQEVFNITGNFGFLGLLMSKSVFR